MNAMEMLTTLTTYPVANYGAGREILHTLRERFRTGGGRHSIHPLTWFDTFDWRLFRDGGTLSARPVSRGCELLWCSHDGDIRHRLRVNNLPAFVWDLPSGRFRRDLAAVAGVRRLLPQVKAEFQGELIQIFDAGNRIVAQVDFEEGTAEAGNGGGSESRVSPLVQVHPRDGSREDYHRIVSFLEVELGLKAQPSRRFDRAIEAAGVSPCSYSPRLALQFEPSTPISEAARRILLHLLQTIKANEDGIRRGLDTEFLHDFRVAVRRSRTCLAQLKEVFPAAATGHFRRELKWVGGATGPSRDLDVHMLRIPRYQRLLPGERRPDLVPLARFLDGRRRIEHAHLVEMLDSARYHALVHDWSNFLDHGSAGDETPLNAHRPCIEIAAERIHSRWRRVLKRGAAIHDDSPAAGLHALRIDCKKLRYLLEFFHSLYDAQDVDPLIRKLKKLQDYLGEMNDLQVQKDALNRFARDMFAAREATPETLLAMGRLQEHLTVQQAKERTHFHRSFSRFAGRKTKEAMQRMIVPAPESPGLA